MKTADQLASELKTRVPSNRSPVWFTKLKEARTRRGLTLKAVASEVGISLGYLSQLEKGFNDPSLSLAVRIASFYTSPVESLWSTLLIEPRRGG